MKLLTLLLAVAALPGMALAASEGTVTFYGEVAAATCQARINGEANGVVLLPTVSIAEFNGAGSTAGLTPFTLAISGCEMMPAGSDLNVTTNFIGYNVTNAGNLSNNAANGASDVFIQLTTDATGTVPVLLNGITPAPGPILQDGETSAHYQFGAQYVTEGGNPGAGAVTAVAEYTLSYL